MQQKEISFIIAFLQFERFVFAVHAINHHTHFA